MSAVIPPGAKVLSTGPLEADDAARLAAHLKQGALTILGGAPSQLPDLRQCYAERDNIMVSPGSREDIPWADGHFLVVLDAQPQRPTPEMLRVLAEGGSIRGLEDMADAL
jgi:hypothetical protein